MGSRCVEYSQRQGPVQFQLKRPSKKKLSRILTAVLASVIQTVLFAASNTGKSVKCFVPQCCAIRKYMSINFSFENKTEKAIFFCTVMCYFGCEQTKQGIKHVCKQ